MKDLYRWALLRRQKRGDWCLLVCEHGRSGYLCGCGHRNPPSIKKRRRLVRRYLDRLDRKYPLVEV